MQNCIKSTVSPEHVILLTIVKRLLSGKRHKKRLKFLKQVARDIGDPTVVPLCGPERRRQLAAVRETWENVLPGLLGE